MEKRLDLRRVRGQRLGLWLVGGPALCLLAVAALGCGSDRYIVIGTARAPSTAGFVEARAGGGESTEIRVHMEQLQKVDNLEPSLHAYVVWFQPDRGTPVRAGSLKYQPDERIGELEALSPFRKFIVKITAEANDTPSAPSAFVVATQDVVVD